MTELSGTVPPVRVRTLGDAPIRAERSYVLYWMIAARRVHGNFGLQRAVDWARQLHRPLIVLEALSCGYRWASHRLHGFVIDGMVTQARHFANSPAAYYPYVEPESDAGRGLLAALAKQACIVVSDDFPGFFLPQMLRRVTDPNATGAIDVALEVVDSNGVYPLAATERVFTTAASFRRHLQKDLRPHLAAWPDANPLRRLPRRKATIPTDVMRRWPMLDIAGLAGSADAGTTDASGARFTGSGHDRNVADAILSRLPIDRTVSRIGLTGGAVAAQARLRRFIERGLPHYADGRNLPDHEVASGLSPYLHFGHLSTHQIFDRVTARDDWSPDCIAERATGSRNGWWGASPEVEAFLDELITWREIGYHTAAKLPDYDDYSSLPAWARKTLDDHASDPRPYSYSLTAFEIANTHDSVWNAAQIQLVREGRIHNYLRMLWGKKILEWSPTPQAALAVMVELNNKYALDGRDPNSYSGIFWCLGRYDRAWGPERPIFGKVRYMSSDSTRRKCKLGNYLATYAA